MSTAVQTNNSTGNAANLAPVDAIANLLVGGEEVDEKDDDTPEGESTDIDEQDLNPDEIETDDEEDAEELSDDSTEEDEDEEDEESTDEGDTDETLAEMLGVSDDQLNVTEDGDFMINLTIDGNQSQMSLKDVIKNVQSEKSVTNRSKALAEEREQFDNLVNTKNAEIEAAIEQNAALAHIMEQELLSEYTNESWDELKEFNPGEYAAKRQDYGIKYQRIQGIKAELQERHTAMVEQARQERHAAQQEYLKGQWEAMVGNNPTWSDKSVYESDMSGLRDFATDAYGFSDADFAHVTDARLIELIKDAKSYRDGKKAATKKRKRSVPKLQKKNSGRGRKKVSRLSKLTRAAKTAKGSDKRRAQMEAGAAILLGEQ